MILILHKEVKIPRKRFSGILNLLKTAGYPEKTF